MRRLLMQLLRAVVIGLVLGVIVFWYIRRQAGTARIQEVRRRVVPRLEKELRREGFALGDPVFVRAFKESREMELWLKRPEANQFSLWKTFHVAALSGELGPKLEEGDGQAPEGFYEITARALNPMSAFHLSLDVGYPNALDRSQNRTGSFIMIHGGQASVGCFAMTDPAIEEIYLVAEAALKNGQPSFFVHVFPFRMTSERMAKAKRSQWLPFWENLREGYEAFERTHLPPAVTVENGRYAFNKTPAP